MPKYLTIEPTSIAKQFAEALDRDDFAAAESLLASECVYEARAGEIMGATAIVSSYREASAWAKDHLDSIQYASRVEDANESRAAVIFIDHITHQGKSHSYQCQHCSASAPTEISCASSTLNFRASGRRSMRSSPL